MPRRPDNLQECLSADRSQTGTKVEAMQCRHFRLISVAVTVLVTLSCGGANVFYKQGRKAELRKDYDTALVNFEKAAQIEPDNPQILLHERMARTQAANFHLRQGKRLLADNRPDEAAGEFQ